MRVGILPLVAALAAQSPAHGRTLTDGERAFLAPIFRNAVDYDDIRIVHGRAFPLQSRYTIVTIGRAIYVPDPAYLADYASAPASRRAILVHEVAHVWQYESGIPIVAGAVRAFLGSGGRYASVYRYRLVPGRDLLAYGIEQQASIIEHYFRASRRQSAVFAGVLAHFLADPRYARHRDRDRHRHPRRPARRRPRPAL